MYKMFRIRYKLFSVLEILVCCNIYINYRIFVLFLDICEWGVFGQLRPQNKVKESPVHPAGRYSLLQLRQTFSERILHQRQWLPISINCQR